MPITVKQCSRAGERRTVEDFEIGTWVVVAGILQRMKELGELGETGSNRLRSQIWERILIVQDLGPAYVSVVRLPFLDGSGLCDVHKSTVLVEVSAEIAILRIDFPE